MFNPFEKLWGGSKLVLWQKKDNKVLGIDIGHSSAKVVQLKKEHGRVILETYGEIALGPYGNLAVGQVASLPLEKTKEMLKDLFGEAGITAKSAAFAIPLGSSLLVILELPDVAGGNLDKIIPIEARKYIPVPISEVELDWWVIPKREGQGTPSVPGKKTIEVLVVAIHKEVVNQYNEIAKISELHTEFFEIETFSAIRAVYEGDPSPVGILDIGAGTSKLAIVDYGVVRLSHTISKGSQDITVALSRSLDVDFARAEQIKREVGLMEKEDDGKIINIMNTITDYIFSEVNKALAIYQQKYRRTISKIILIGGGALLKGMLETAGKSFEVPVTLGHAFGKVEYPAFLDKVLREIGPSFTVAVGLATRQLERLE
ncbi:MAG: type IV pilus assembly protein PilM [Patescibacteria group bacterium]